MQTEFPSAHERMRCANSRHAGPGAAPTIRAQTRPGHSTETVQIIQNQTAPDYLVVICILKFPAVFMQRQARYRLPVGTGGKNADTRGGRRGVCTQRGRRRKNRTQQGGTNFFHHCISVWSFSSTVIFFTPSVGADRVCEKSTDAPESSNVADGMNFWRAISAPSASRETIIKSGTP